MSMVLREAVTNVVRHAAASRVELSLLRIGADLVLEVADDGRGLGDASWGTGLVGMRDRAALVGAQVEVVSSGSGTTVRLRVPVSRVVAAREGAGGPGSAGDGVRLGERG